MPTTAFYRDLAAGTFRVGVMGQGYVGLPLALAFSRRITAIGFDVNQERVCQLKDGKSGMRHIDDGAIAQALRARRYIPTHDPEQLRTCDAIVVCVPTPLGEHREPDLQFVHGAARILAEHLKPGALVCLESTTYPGTTAGDFRRIIELGADMVAGKDFHLAYSPEREDPGNAEHTTQTIPKIVGGYTPACLEQATALYGRAVKTVVPVSSIEHAEMCKLYENIFRCVNIALANETKVICDALGLDIWEVIRAASSKPFGFMPFTPGPGLGGHCIPIDPFYLTWAARKARVSTRFIELAGEVNGSMPEHVAARVAKALNAHGKPLRGARIMAIGLAYKPNVEDTRESPSVEVFHALKRSGAHVRYHDPHVDMWRGKPSVELTRDTLDMQDAVVILTDHAAVDYSLIADHARIIVDTRDAMRTRAAGKPTRSPVVRA